MPITVQIPAPLREAAGGHLEVLVTGATVKDALADLLRQHPPLEAKLFDKGQLRPYVNVVVNDEDIRYLDDLDTKLADGNTVLALIPAVAGG